MDDADLFEIEIETLWTADEQGRLSRAREPRGLPAPDLVLCICGAGQRLAFGCDLPDALAAELRALVEPAAANGAPSTAPAVLMRCAVLIERALGQVDVYSGPSYIVPATHQAGSQQSLLHSDQPGRASLLPPPEGWTEDEWRVLLSGELGPWAMAAAGDEVVSLCHSSRWGPRGAEAGVWTHPEHRGRGHAASVTAAWAALVSASGRLPFYSTSASNVSSQRVAMRLGARNIGWMWSLRRAQE